MRFSIASFLFLFITLTASAQDEVLYKKQSGGFYQDSILPAIRAFDSPQDDGSRATLTMDFSNLTYPGEVNDYESFWHNPPLSQGATGTCWCFSTISFLESEAFRITGKRLKFSEMYIVYWEYVARAEYFVENRGDMYFGQGSEANAVTRAMKRHGLVPSSQYSGMKKGQKFHSHGKMARELKSYLDFVKANNLWDASVVVANVRAILDHYMGTPPGEVVLKDGTVSPISYMRDVAELNPDDYFCFISTKSQGYNQQGELKEPDNWWHSDDYYNIPLDDFSGLLTEALSQGYTLAFCGDNSEPGYDRYAEVGIIPSFDIPKQYINEDSREFRLYNGSTTDDHCMHIIGYTEHDGESWYLIKDSASSGFDGPNKGYRFLREDYVKLKVMAIMTHKNAARQVLDRIIK